MKKIFFVLWVSAFMPSTLLAQEPNQGEILNIYSINSGEIVTQLRSIAQKLSTSSVWLSTDESTQTKTGGLIIGGQINGVIVNHSSLTTQGNLISISSNASAINQVINSSNTLWLPLDGSTNTKIGGLSINGQINGVIVNHSSLTTQGNLISISTNAGAINRVITSSNTLWMPLDSSTSTKTGGARFGGNVSMSSLTVRQSGVSINGINYGFPPADGTDNQVLTTNGSGVLTWEDDDTGGGGTSIRTYRVVIGTTSTFSADIIGTTDQAFSAAVSTLGGTSNGKGTIFVQGAGTVYLFSNTVEIPKNIEVIFEASATIKSTGGTKVFDIKGKLVNPTFDFEGLATAGWITFSSGSMIQGGKAKAIMNPTSGTPITFQVLNASNVVIDGLELTFIDFNGTANNSAVFFDIENSTRVIVQRCKFPSQHSIGHAGNQLIRIRGGYDILITDNDLEWKRRILGMSNQSGQFAFRNVRVTNNRITVPASGVATDGMIYIDCNANIAYSSSVVFSGNYVHFVDSTTAADPFIFMDTAAGAQSLVDAPIITNNIVTANHHTQTQFLKIDTKVRKPIIRGNVVNGLATFLNDLGASGVINSDNYLNGLLQ